MVDRGSGVRAGDAHRRPHVPRLRRLRGSPARGVRLEQDPAVGRLRDGPGRERHPRARAGLADRSLRPPRADPGRHADLRPRLPAVQPDHLAARLLRHLLHDGARLQPGRLSADRGGHRRLVRAAAGAGLQHQLDRDGGGRAAHTAHRSGLARLRLALDGVLLRRAHPPGRRAHRPDRAASARALRVAAGRRSTGCAGPDPGGARRSRLLGARGDTRAGVLVHRARARIGPTRGLGRAGPPDHPRHRAPGLLAAAGQYRGSGADGDADHRPAHRRLGPAIDSASGRSSWPA